MYVSMFEQTQVKQRLTQAFYLMSNKQKHFNLLIFEQDFKLVLPSSVCSHHRTPSFLTTH